MNILELEKRGKQVRKEILGFKTRSGMGHLQSCLSCVDIMVSLYYDQETYFNHRNDMMLFSKAHGSPSVYPILADLGYFDLMIPCGIKDKAVTSLNVEMGKKEVDMSEVKKKLLKHFTHLFEAKLITEAPIA